MNTCSVVANMTIITQLEDLSKLNKIVTFHTIQSRNAEEDKLNTFDAHSTHLFL